jgi:hypothetical protein
MEKLVTDEKIRKIILREWSEGFQNSTSEKLKKCANCKRFLKQEEHLEVYKSSFGGLLNYSIRCTKPLCKCKNGILSLDDALEEDPYLGIFY